MSAAIALAVTATLLASAAARAAGPDGAHTLELRVSAVSPAGAVAPAADVAASLELWTSPAPPQRGPPTLARAWTAQAATGGRVRFSGHPDPGPRQRYAVVVRYREIAWPIEPLDTLDGHLNTLVYEPSVDLGALHMDLRLSVQPTEGAFRVHAVVHVVNPTLTAIVTGDDPGLRIPLLTPLVFGAPLDPGLVPLRPDLERLLLAAAPRMGRLVTERGGVFFQGAVPPGRELTVDVRYAIPYLAGRERYSLGLRPSVDLDRAWVQASHSDLIAPRLAVRGDVIAEARPFGGGRERLMRLVTPPRAGEPLVIDVAHVPTRRPLNAAVALFGALALTLLVALGLLRARRAAAAAAAARLDRP